MEHIDDLVLGQMLLERGKIKPAQLESTRSTLPPGKTLAQGLVDARIVTKEDIENLLSNPTVHPKPGKAPIRPDAAAKTKIRSAPPDENLPADVREMAKNPDYCFDKFVLLGMLGKGGMGEVWKAWQRDLRRYVAIKFLEMHDGLDLDRFIKEAQTAASLNHPNITSMFELSKFDDRYYIVMEFVDGVTLQDSQGKITPNKAARVIREAAGALDYAHRLGIIHRDVKPQNIMMSRAGRVYIMDFGLAKQQGDQNSNTLAGMVVGTPAFMPPEQAEGKISKMDKRVDVYSLGSTLYALMTGRPPVTPMPLMAMLQKVVHGDIPAPRKINPRIPVEMEAIILKAMDRQPQGRYLSAAAMAEDLRRFMDGEPITAAAPSIWKAVRHSAKQNRGPLVTAGVIALVSIVGFIAFQAARSGTVDQGELRRKEEQLAKSGAKLKQSDAEIEKQKLAIQARADLDKARQAYLDAERIFVVDMEPWSKLTIHADGAVSAAASVLKSHSKSAEAQVLLGQAHLLKLDFAAAETALMAALSIDPQLEAAYPPAVRLYLMWGEDQDFARDPWSRRGTAEGDAIRKKAAPLIEKYLGLKIPDGDRALAEAQRHFVSREFPKAVESGLKAVKAAPSRWEAHYILARSLSRVGRTKEGAAAIEITLRQNRNHPVILLAVASMYMKIEKKDSAVSTLESLVTLQPENIPGWCLLAGARADAAKFKEAHAAADQAVKRAPRQGHPLAARGLVSLAEKKTEDAFRAFGEAVSNDPNCRAAYLGRSTVRTDPEADLAKVLELQSEDAGAWKIRANLHLAAGNVKEGLAALGRAAELDLSIAPDYLFFMVTPCAMYREAVEEGKKFRELSPNDGTILLSLGWAQAECREFLDAYETLNRADQLLGNASRILFWRGWTCYNLNQCDQALADFDQVIRINPDDGDAYCRRGLVYGKMGRYREACDSLAKGLEMWPQLRLDVEKRWEEKLREFDLKRK